LVNGVPSDSVPITDRGFAYGDGIFETILVVDGRAVLWDEHIARLMLGVTRLNLPYELYEDLQTRVVALANAFCNEVSAAPNKKPSLRHLGAASRCIVKVMITRGSGGRGYSPLGCVSANEILACFPPLVISPAIYEFGITIRILATPVSRNDRLAGIKHLNRLDQVLAAAELRDCEFEGVMCDTGGCLAEGTRSNILYKINGAWCTPELNFSGVYGVLRSFLLNGHNQLGISIVPANIDRSACSTIEAMAVVNSVFGVVPVSSIDNQKLDVNCVIEEIQRPVHQQIPFRFDQ